MWQYLVPAGLNLLQGDSNRKAQAEQAAITQRFQPWLGSGTGTANLNTNDGNVLSQSFGAFNAAQNEINNEKNTNNLMGALLGNQGSTQNQFMDMEGANRDAAIQSYGNLTPNAVDYVDLMISMKKSKFDMLGMSQPGTMVG